MRAWTKLAALLGCVLAALAAPAVSPGAPPPPGDPCAKAHRDSCGTAGVGFYRTYRFGTRWFGDYRGALAVAGPTFCIDLGYWYASRAYRYREVPSAGLRNRDREAVPAVRRQRLAYAMWAFGRSGSPSRQAAVMLYVHAQMGDARPGELDPKALGAPVASFYRTIAAAAVRYHGPYRIDVRRPPTLTVATRAPVSIRVLSAAGHPVPSVRLELSARGAEGLPRRAVTDGAGVARLALTPTDAAGLRLSVAAKGLPATAPRIFVPTSDAAAGKGQRLAAPSSQTVSATVTAPVRGRPQLVTAVQAQRLVVGGEARDRVTVSGVPASWRGTVTVRVHGPFRTRGAVRCDGPVAWQASVPAAAGSFLTPGAQLVRPGWYTYQEVVAPDAEQAGFVTPCGVAQETLRVEVQPSLTTSVAAPAVPTGGALSDRVFVTGLAGERATVQAALYGPFPSRDAIDCATTPVWTGSIPVAADGEYHTQPFTPTSPGLYVYREWIEASGLVRPVRTPCAESAEIASVTAQPQLATRLRTQPTAAGSTVVDTVTISGLGDLEVPVGVALWGPFPTRDAVRCSGTPAWTGSFRATGDGTYTTAPARLERAGYYTYTESIAASATTAAVATPCGETSETTLERARPTLETNVSRPLVRPGTTVTDLVRVRRLRGATTDVHVEVFGPFPARGAIRCGGRPAWQGRLTTTGDRDLSTAPVPLPRAGFYAFRARIPESTLVVGTATRCTGDTSLAVPRIVTGRNDVERFVAAPPAGPRTPLRVRIPTAGIDAPVAPAAIDVVHGVLGVPKAIGRTGWWRDGMAPGDASGAILIAGHVDSAHGGTGAFFALPHLHAGDRIELATAGGRTYAYRVQSLRHVPKDELPTSVYAREGPPRLVLVTCGGRFDRATRHYPDNVIVTATPVGPER